MEVDQFVSADFVEGQSAGRIVHIHCYSPGVRAGGGDGCFSVIVTDIISTTGAGHSPGMIISSKYTGIIFPIPADSFVTHCYVNPSFPLNLPVAAPSQTSNTQQLFKVVKSVWMKRI